MTSSKNFIGSRVSYTIVTLPAMEEVVVTGTVVGTRDESSVIIENDDKTRGDHTTKPVSTITVLA